MNTPVSRRRLVQAASASLLLSGMPALRAQEAARRFDPRPSDWRSFEVVTTVQLADPAGPATVWLPVPSLDTAWQRTQDVSWTSTGGDVRLATDGDTGAKVLVARFDAGAPQPRLTLTARVDTRNRGVDWTARAPAAADAADLRRWLQPSALITTDGIVRKVALQIVDGAASDREKVQRIYDWVIVSTYREPKVRGCGVGDIRDRKSVV